jgi:hypothetical protein
LSFDQILTLIPKKKKKITAQKGLLLKQLGAGFISLDTAISCLSGPVDV